MNVNVTKTNPIEFKWVVDAYGKVRKGGKASGIDKESWTDFDKDVQKNLYLIWNRLSSGSYFPQAVREVEIPKKDGSMRKLGIPTLRDRIAQQVIKNYMEQRIERIFHPNSYGYRPLKSAHAALKEVSKNCVQYNWVIDMDISKFFDEIDHEIMLKAVEHVLEEKWVSMYVKRWLEAPTQLSTGELKQKEGKGTPQGGVISPLLANLYLHFTLDKWIEKHLPDVSFVRYADDVVIHCHTKQRAEEVLQLIKERLSETKLEIKESKTKIAYCKDYKRKLQHEHVSFDFLGFCFKPTKFKSKFPESGEYYTGYGADISQSSKKKINQVIKDNNEFKNTSLEITDLATQLNPKLRGWIDYYCLFSQNPRYWIGAIIDAQLRKWIKKKYKLISFKHAQGKLLLLKQQHPKLFYHWTYSLMREI